MNLTLQQIQKIREGDEGAFTAFFESYYDWVYVRALKVLQNPFDTEEATQDVFLKVWQKIGLYDAAKGSFEGWLATLTFHTAIDIVRKRNRSNAIETVLSERAEEFFPLDAVACEQHHPPQDLIAQETLACIEAALETMTSSKMRLAWILRHLEGYRYKDIAHILQISIGYAKKCVHQAKRFLRSKLQSKLGEPDGKY